jgi:hypothetical protein
VPPTARAGRRAERDRDLSCRHAIRTCVRTATGPAESAGRSRTEVASKTLATCGRCDDLRCARRTLSEGAHLPAVRRAGATLEPMAHRETPPPPTWRGGWADARRRGKAAASRLARLAPVRLLRLVQLSSEQERQAVRLDCSFVKAGVPLCAPGRSSKGSAPAAQHAHSLLSHAGRAGRAATSSVGRMHAGCATSASSATSTGTRVRTPAGQVGKRIDPRVRRTCSVRTLPLMQ